jgi:hypothetical protein
MRTVHTECLRPDQFHSAAISDVLVREQPDEEEDEEEDEGDDRDDNDDNDDQKENDDGYSE